LAVSRRNTRVALVVWRAMLRQRPYFPRDSAALLIKMGARLRLAKMGRHGGRPSTPSPAFLPHPTNLA
jgi:hypothetical protein